MVSGLISLVLIKMGYALFTCYISAVMFGITMAITYPLAFSINTEFGRKLTEHQASNLIAWGFLG